MTKVYQNIFLKECDYVAKNRLAQRATSVKFLKPLLRQTIAWVWGHILHQQSVKKSSWMIGAENQPMSKLARKHLVRISYAHLPEVEAKKQHAHQTLIAKPKHHRTTPAFQQPGYQLKGQQKKNEDLVQDLNSCAATPGGLPCGGTIENHAEAYANQSVNPCEMTGSSQPSN